MWTLENIKKMLLNLQPTRLLHFSFVMYRRLATLLTTRRITNAYSRLRIQPTTILHGNRSLTSTITPLPLGVTTKRAFTVTTVNFQAQQSMEEDMNNIEELFSVAKDEVCFDYFFLLYY